MEPRHELLVRQHEPLVTVSNMLRGGLYRTDTAYDFTGRMLKCREAYDGRTMENTYVYDSRSRLLSVSASLNGNAPVSLIRNEYDGVGRLKSVTYNGKANLKTEYSYNIRSWVTNMSNPLYSQTLTYGYGGNIATQQWVQDSKTRKYTYTYDGLNRLTHAAYTGDGNYTANYSYDNMGNITSLKRYDVSLVDNLTYTYNGNQLTKVEDATSNAFGFANGASTTNEYTYDANGNLTKDSNKGIASITYNSLNLPQVVTFSNGNTITYLYAADGKKLRTVHVTNGTATTTDYCGNVIYENGTARLLLTETGYVDLTDNSHHFYIKDHLGNNRVVADANGTVEESNQYYPFGLNYANANSNLQPYKYNGKELDTKNGLNWYDYGARHYDAALGRWHVVDPLGEKYYSTSPYAYCLDNPVKYVDPTGMLASPIYDENGNFLGTDDEGLQGSAIVMDKSKFKQGMSHEEAQKYNLGYDGLVDENAKVNLLQNFNSLPDRPDYDGFVTIDEGIAWAKAHPNALNNPTSENSLYINTAFMDFGELSVNDIGIRNLGKNYKTNLYTLNNTLKSITDEKLRASVYALGRINIILHNPITGAVSVVNDDATDYDWNKGGGIMRSIAIQLERWRTGLNDSHGFRAIYYGRGYLNK